MLFKKKKPRRPVFGFLCSPTLAALIRGTARNLRLPIFCLAEHVVQAGLAVILPQLEDEGFRERLCAHLIESHLLVDAAGENEYDRAAMAEARQKEVARLEREKVIRLLGK